MGSGLKRQVRSSVFRKVKHFYLRSRSGEVAFGCQDVGSCLSDCEQGAVEGQTCWFNSNPVAFAGVSATTNHLACPHVAVEVRGGKSSNAFFRTIELLGHLGGIKASRGPVALHPLPVDQHGNGHQIVFSVYGSSIDVYRLQWVQLILSIESHLLTHREASS